MLLCHVTSSYYNIYMVINMLYNQVLYYIYVYIII